MGSDFIEKCLGALLALITLGLGLFIGGCVYEAWFSNTECKVYSELRTKHGFVMVGKVAVPTTYQSRDCLVHGEKESSK